MNEFEVIQHFFNRQSILREDVNLTIGDDAAIITPPAGHQIAITTDTLVYGVHFPIDTSPYDIGFKSLAVNLSDLAAMGATPAWLTLALTLPSVDELWLKEFSDGFFSLASKYQAQLIGGDLTRGPLTITIAAHGLIPTGQALKRNTAKPGDLIYVTNTLGDAAAALAFLQNKTSIPDENKNSILTKLNRPIPQIKTGEQLRDIATSCIDISDGLVADLGHILEKSAVGAEVNVDCIPLSETLQKYVNKEEALHFALSGGDDYELCFTVPADKINFVPANCTCIGKIINSNKLNLQFSDGKKYDLTHAGYQHF